MYFEGFLRSLQGDFMTTMLALFAIGIAYWLFRVGLKQAPTETSELAVDLSKTVNRVCFILITLIVVLFVGRAMSAGFSNRLPRQDVDKGPVYEQMDNH